MCGNHEHETSLPEIEVATARKADVEVDTPGLLVKVKRGDRPRRLESKGCGEEFLVHRVGHRSNCLVCSV